jgi:hypothetical protein
MSGDGGGLIVTAAAKRCMTARRSKNVQQEDLCAPWGTVAAFAAVVLKILEVNAWISSGKSAKVGGGGPHCGTQTGGGLR